MNRDFVLAASFAAAVHGALLFGFPHTPSVSAVTTRTVIKEFPLSPPLDEEPVPVVQPDATNSGPKTPLEAPVIRSQEPITIDTPTPFIVPKPDVPPFDPHRVTNAIPTEFARTGPGIGEGLSVVPAVALDKSPQTRFQPSPIYPQAAKFQGLNGEVIVEFMVDETGRVHDPRVVSSSDRVFDENALRAVAKWVFEPGKRNNQVVRFRMSVPIVFKLNE